MSKSKRKTHDKIYMEVNSVRQKDPYLLQVPDHFRHILDKMSGVEYVVSDYRNSACLLKVFCDEFCDLSDKKKHKFEMLINSKAAPVSSIADLLFMVLQIDKYYVLQIKDCKALGEFHIISAKQTDPESWVAQSTFDDAEEVGRKIMKLENGKFFRDIM
ncbi:MAG: hypothetical protein IKT56_01030 [Clostridia bacterium]|nr:hypothetical protein [Clostridia bacterium]